ncbi:hypothetical protein HOY82DRAFT_597369 [Tuber indicum]|nr:hypothetical protein HOY82DRAFT_597369 [Tuber indicum]
MPPIRSRPRRHALKEVVEEAVNNKSKSKPGPKPKPLVECQQKFAPEIKRKITTRPRERKLAILQYLHYAHVPISSPGENQLGREDYDLRHVTLAEVAERYKVPLSTISDWKRQANKILGMDKGGRSNQLRGICMYLSQTGL